MSLASFRLSICCLALICLLALGSTCWQWYDTFIYGPHVVSRAEIVSELETLPIVQRKQAQLTLGKYKDHVITRDDLDRAKTAPVLAAEKSATIAEQQTGLGGITPHE